MTRCTIIAMTMTASASLAHAQLITFDTLGEPENPLVNGQLVSDAGEFPAAFSIGSSGGLGAVIFDSDPGGPNLGTQDPDLMVGLGNILIVQNDLFPTMTTPGVFDTPNDEPSGGSVWFDFAEPVIVLAIDLIDIDRHNQGVTVTLSDISGLVRSYVVDDAWSTDISVDGPNGYDTLDLATLDEQFGEGGGSATASEDPGFDPGSIVSIEVAFAGSGGLDNLLVVPSPGPAVLALLGVLALVKRR